MSLAAKLAQERRGRLAAERLLELKQAELYAANRKLGQHARALSEEIVETRAEVASVRDENRRVKSDLSVAHQKIEIAERRLWHSIQSIQDWFAFYDTDDKLIAANDSFISAFDGLEDVVPGVHFAHILQLLTDEGIVDTEDRSAADWRAFMMQRRQHPEPDPVVLRLWNDEFVKIVDHRAPSGDLISLGLNITATVRYERDLQAARQKAEAAARAKSAFLANMSHEIRTPMNGVVGMAQILADGDLTEEQQLYVDTIRNSGEALLVIINDILDYSKIEASKVALHLGPFDLEKTIHEVLMLLQPAAREKNIGLHLDYDLFLPHRFIGDMGRLRQVLTNLIGNAVKFTSEGHVLVRVIGGPCQPGQPIAIHLTVEDTGIGIAEDKLDQIFGEFTQVEDERNRKFEGTGLGLAISKKLVGLMGGEVWVTSTLGEGSCFGFRVALEAADDSKRPPAAIPQHLREALIIDASEANREIVFKHLAFLGIVARSAASPEEALERIEAHHDLIFIDESMLDKNPDGLMADLRARGFAQPVIRISGAISGSEAAAPGDCAATLTRPVSRDRLIATLSEVADLLPEAPAQDAPPACLPSPSDVSEVPGDTGLPRAAPGAQDPDDADMPAGTPVFRSRSAVPRTMPVDDAEPFGDPSNPVAPGEETPPEPEDSASGEPLNPQGGRAEPVGAPAVSQPAPDADADRPHETVASSEQDSANPQASEPAVDDPRPEPAAPPSAESDLEEPTVPTARDIEATAPTARPPGRMRILAAEDNKTNRLVLSKLLKSLDIDLDMVVNGAEAVAAYQSFCPDLIFMDISMPEMDGKEATRAIRKIERDTGAHVPIVALTAHAMQGDDDPIMAAGLDHYLTKPLRKPEIFRFIRASVPGDAPDPFPDD